MVRACRFGDAAAIAGLLNDLTAVAHADRERMGFDEEYVLLGEDFHKE